MQAAVIQLDTIPGEVSYNVHRVKRGHAPDARAAAVAAPSQAVPSSVRMTSAAI